MFKIWLLWFFFSYSFFSCFILVHICPFFTISLKTFLFSAFKFNKSLAFSFLPFFGEKKKTIPVKASKIFFYFKVLHSILQKFRGFAFLLSICLCVGVFFVFLSKLFAQCCCLFIDIRTACKRCVTLNMNGFFLTSQLVISQLLYSPEHFLLKMGRPCNLSTAANSSKQKVVSKLELLLPTFLELLSSETQWRHFNPNVAALTKWFLVLIFTNLCTVIFSAA